MSMSSSSLVSQVTQRSIVDLARTNSKKELEKISRKRAVQLDKKNKKLDHLEEEILEMKDRVAKSTIDLKKKREHEKDCRVASSRILSHTKTLSIDGEKRPSDRSYDIRHYSKMDGDIWRYDQVRNWFNSYAVDQEPYKFVPSQTGYTLKADG